MNAPDPNASNGSGAPAHADDAGTAAATPSSPFEAQRPQGGWQRQATRDFRGRGLSLTDFRDEMSSILDDVGYLLRHESVVNPELKAQLEQRFDRLRGTVTLLAEDARQTGERVRSEVQDRVQLGIAQSREAVVERPITSLATATVVGVAIGLLLARRH